MSTLKELADKRAHLKSKIELIQDLLSWGFSVESHLKDQYGETLHDEVMNELDEKWLTPLSEELQELESLEIDDGSKKGKGRVRRVPAKGKAKAKG